MKEGLVGAVRAVTRAEGVVEAVREWAFHSQDSG